MSAGRTAPRAEIRSVKTQQRFSPLNRRENTWRTVVVVLVSDFVPCRTLLLLVVALFLVTKTVWKVSESREVDARYEETKCESER